MMCTPNSVTIGCGPISPLGIDWQAVENSITMSSGKNQPKSPPDLFPLGQALFSFAAVSKEIHTY